MTPEWAIISVLAGIALGMRYKVVILVPAVTLAIIFAMIVGIARADRFWSIILAMVTLGTAVQLGYLAGTAIRAVVGSSARWRSEAAIQNSILKLGGRRTAFPWLD